LSKYRQNRRFRVLASFKFMIDKYVEVVLPLPLDKVFQYGIPAENQIPIFMGQRVEVPFTNRQLVGYIIGLSDKPLDYPLKPFTRLIDITPTVTPEFFTLSRWLAKHYACSWGEALSAILPGNLRPTRSAASTLPPPPSIVSPFLPSPEQNSVLRQIGEKMVLHQFAPFLLYGITDSGKTEVYLQAIGNALALGRQAIFFCRKFLSPPNLSLSFASGLASASVSGTAGFPPGKDTGFGRRPKRAESMSFSECARLFSLPSKIWELS